MRVALSLMISLILANLDCGLGHWNPPSPSTIQTPQGFPECISGWTYFKPTKKCFKFIETRMNRADAIKSCKESMSTANFASIPDETTNSFVQSKVSWRSWIGLEKVNGQWVWPDGTKATYLPWDRKHNNPSGDGPFVEIWADSEGPGKWNDLASSHKRGAVCQYDINVKGQRCFGRNYEGGKRCCTPENPCGEGEGDCDGPGDGGQHDGHAGCRGNLVCGSNNCKKFAEYYHEKDDCCERPNSGISQGWGSWSSWSACSRTHQWVTGRCRKIRTRHCQGQGCRASQELQERYCGEWKCSYGFNFNSFF